MNRAPRIVRTARAVTIGAEILSGKVHDTNSFELARTLRRLGIELTGIAIVSDEIGEIERAVREAHQNAEVVFTSGGIGPTHDDRTVAGVARALGRRLSGLVPEGAELIQLGNPNWPTLVVDRVWLLPGVPELFRSKLGWLGEHLLGPSPILSRSLYLDADEVDIVKDLNEVVSRHPDVEIGSYPTWSTPRFRTQVTFDARSEAPLLLALQDFESRVTTRIVPGPKPDQD